MPTRSGGPLSTARMPTAGERKALWFFALVALSGSAVRVWRPESGGPTRALDRQLHLVDSMRAARADLVRGAGARRRPSAAPAGQAPRPGPIDLDRAPAAEIEGLPGIGPTLAARIVAARDSGGAFGRLEALCEVRGVGPVLAERLRPLVTFSGPPRPVSVACGEGSKTSRKARAARHRK